jgi:uncharacterized membrane protein YjjB (DUF3815 family)
MKLSYFLCHCVVIHTGAHRFDFIVLESAPIKFVLLSVLVGLCAYLISYFFASRENLTKKVRIGER